MRVKLMHTPIGISEYTDRWGVPTGEYYVGGYHFYLNEDFWKEIDEFQRFKVVLADNATDILSSGRAPITTEKMIENARKAIKNFDDMDRLIKRAGSRTVWEFNAYKNANPSETGEEEYIRSYAVFGSRHVIEYKRIHDAQRFLLKPVVYLLNLWSIYFGENKTYRKWLKEHYGDL